MTLQIVARRGIDRYLHGLYFLAIVGIGLIFYVVNQTGNTSLYAVALIFGLMMPAFSLLGGKLRGQVVFACEGPMVQVLVDQGNRAQRVQMKFKDIHSFRIPSSPFTPGIIILKQGQSVPVLTTLMTWEQRRQARLALLQGIKSVSSDNPEPYGY